MPPSRWRYNRLGILRPSAEPPSPLRAFSAPVVSFRDGLKYVNGVPYSITGSRQEWSSNGTTIYTALMWSDGKASCNCPGWATSKTVDKFGNPKDKTCAHSKRVQVGMAITVDSGRHVATALPVEAAPKKRKIIL